MENHENKELLKEATKQSLEQLKDLEPGTNEYATAVNDALKMYDTILKDEAQESDKNQKQETIKLDREKSKKARRLEIAKLAMQGVTFLGTIGMTVYWSICEAGGVTQLSGAMREGLHEIKRGFTERK